jgi:broad specificity phosphatase PhoE
MPGPSKIMFIRHGEKSLGAAPFGVKEDGTQSQHSLTPQGWQRAGALAAFFTKPVRDEISRPTHLYAAPPDQNADSPTAGDIDKSHRPVQTVTPLSRKLPMPIDQRFTVGQESEIAADIKQRDGVVLVSWEHRHIPLIAGVFNSNVPDKWPDRYDLVWVLDAQDGGTYSFKIIPQLLLGTDQPA